MIKLARAVLIVIAAVFLGGCGPRKSAQEQQRRAAPAPQAANFKTHWQTESAYFVETIANDLACMAAYAGLGASFRLDQIKCDVTPKANPGQEQLSFRVAVVLPDHPSIETELTIKDSIFAPEVYAPLVTQLFGKLGITISESPSDFAGNHLFLQALTTPTARRLVLESNALSASLKADFLSPALHESAALLVATFSLQEDSGYFFQARAELCRVAAHLAFASALRGKASHSPESVIARAAFATLLNNQKEGLRLLDSIEDKSSCVAAWITALRIRITGDYRIPTSPQATLLERLEKTRAKAIGVDSEVVVSEFANDTELTGLPAWCRLLNSSRPGVQLGHQLLRSALGTEISEASAVCEMAIQQNLNPNNIETLLNQEPEPTLFTPDGNGTVLSVIGWGHWAGFFQRHICHAMQNDFEFLMDKWGVPEKANEYRAWADQTFSKLRLYPFVRRLHATETSYYRKAQEDSMKVVRTTPHLVPSEVWNQICYYPRKGVGAIFIPPPHAFVNEWHRLNPQPGTAYDIDPRLNQPSLTGRSDYLALMNKLHEIAPYDVSITHYLLLKNANLQRRETATYQEMQKGYGPVADYNGPVASAIASAAKSDQAAYEACLLKYEAIDPAPANYLLGDFYVAQKREADAAKSYAKAIKSDNDDVRISNNVGWLVKYYEKTGNTAAADALADSIADSYSRTGLETKALLLESRGDLTGALELYKKVEERYDAPDSVLAFLIRIENNKPSPALHQLFLKKSRALFPRGMEKIDLAKMTQPPVAGVKIRYENDLTRECGLTMSDVIVGIRGIVTPGTKAYMAVRDSQPNTPFKLTLWRNGKYLEIEASPPDNRFYVELDEFQP